MHVRFYAVALGGRFIGKGYLPTSGRLLIDGVDIRAVRSDSLHAQMGIVLQQNFLFHGTVAENIRAGRPDASDAEVMDVLERLDCADRTLAASATVGCRAMSALQNQKPQSASRLSICW